MNSKSIINTLRADGWLDRQIGEAIGRDRFMIWRIRTGKTEHTDEETYRRLLQLLEKARAA